MNLFPRLVRSICATYSNATIVASDEILSLEAGKTLAVTSWARLVGARRYAAFLVDSAAGLCPFCDSHYGGASGEIASHL